MLNYVNWQEHNLIYYFAHQLICEMTLACDKSKEGEKKDWEKGGEGCSTGVRWRVAADGWQEIVGGQQQLMVVSSGSGCDDNRCVREIRERRGVLGERREKN